MTRRSLYRNELWLGHRQRELKRAALAHGGLDGQCSAMRFGNSARDGQAESQAATIGTPRLPEAIEQSCAVLLRNSWTGVGDRDVHAAISNAAADRDRAATGPELYRIPTAVVEQLKA